MDETNGSTPQCEERMSYEEPCEKVLITPATTEGLSADKTQNCSPSCVELELIEPNLEQASQGPKQENASISVSETASRENENESAGSFTRIEPEMSKNEGKIEDVCAKSSVGIIQDCDAEASKTASSASISETDLLRSNEDSLSSTQSVTSSRNMDPILKQSSIITAASIIEYQWPDDGSGDYYMIQEQISGFLGVTSFKRKYPEIDRHKLGPQELNHLMLKMLVSEVQVTLGLTAVRSRDVCDLMMREYPEKYQEYILVLDERRKENIKGKHQQYSTPAVEKSQLPNYMKKAMKQVSDFNARLNRQRKDDYSVYYDMQTNVLQSPSWKFKKLHPDLTRPSLYPCSLIPGQFQEYCQKYSSDELSYFPLNTVIYGPPPPPPESAALIQDSDSEPETNLPESVETETADTKTDKSNDEEENDKASKVKEENSEPASSPVAETPLQSEENSNSNSAHSSSNKDVDGATDSPYIKEDTMQSFIDDPDKPVCGICLNDETANKRGEPEDLISCSQCDNYGHPSCLDMSKELVSVIVTYNWQCLECKTCTYCNKPHHEDKMMFCDRCDRGYHTFCVGLRNLPSGLWMCPQCTRSDPDFAKKGGGRKGTPRKRKITAEGAQNPDGTPKPKRKRRTKKEMEEAREKERLEKEEKLKKKKELKEEKEERRRKRRTRRDPETEESALPEQDAEKDVKTETIENSPENTAAPETEEAEVAPISEESAKQEEDAEGKSEEVK